MAVQAPNTHKSNLCDLRNRPVQYPAHMDLSSVDPKSFFASLPVYASLEDCQQFVPTLASPALHNQMIFQQHSAAAPISAANLTLFQQQPGAGAHAPGTRKRRTDSNESRTIKQQQQQQPTPQQAPVMQLVDLNQAQRHSPVSAPQSILVSTGLRLSFDDENSTVTSSRPDAGSMVGQTLHDDLSINLLQQQQQQEIHHFLKSQGEHLRHALEERTQQHSRVLMATIEEEINRRFRDRELELDCMSRRNLELEERVKQLFLEIHMWQNKAKSNEAMVAVLRTNLQQMVEQSREQSKVEGCGDSEADDGASAHIDDNAEAQQARASMMMLKIGRDQGGELVRACRRCRMKEACILLIPCLHLCLCNDCKGEVETCPVCNSFRSACVEVYLS